MTTVSGGSSDRISFPPGSIPNDFTFIVLSKYNGNMKNRIIQSLDGNWLIGHWDSKSGVCYQNNWIFVKRCRFLNS